VGDGRAATPFPFGTAHWASSAWTRSDSGTRALSERVVMSACHCVASPAALAVIGNALRN
jgi:hypothetical protein